MSLKVMAKKLGNPENFKGKGFHTNPERINKKGRPKLPSLQEEMAKLLSDEKKRNERTFNNIKDLRKGITERQYTCNRITIEACISRAQTRRG